MLKHKITGYQLPPSEVRQNVFSFNDDGDLVIETRRMSKRFKFWAHAMWISLVVITLELIVAYAWGII